MVLGSHMHTQRKTTCSQIVTYMLSTILRNLLGLNLRSLALWSPWCPLKPGRSTPTCPTTSWECHLRLCPRKWLFDSKVVLGLCLMMLKAYHGLPKQWFGYDFSPAMLNGNPCSNPYLDLPTMTYYDLIWSVINFVGATLQNLMLQGQRWDPPVTSLAPTWLQRHRASMSLPRAGIHHSTSSMMHRSHMHSIWTHGIQLVYPKYKHTCLAGSSHIIPFQLARMSLAMVALLTLSLQSVLLTLTLQWMIFNLSLSWDLLHVRTHMLWHATCILCCWFAYLLDVHLIYKLGWSFCYCFFHWISLLFSNVLSLFSTTFCLDWFLCVGHPQEAVVDLGSPNGECPPVSTTPIAEHPKEMPSTPVAVPLLMAKPKPQPKSKATAKAKTKASPKRRTTAAKSMPTKRMTAGTKDEVTTTGKSSPSRARVRKAVGKALAKAKGSPKDKASPKAQASKVKAARKDWVMKKMHCVTLSDMTICSMFGLVFWFNSSWLVSFVHCLRHTVLVGATQRTPTCLLRNVRVLVLKHASSDSFLLIGNHLSNVNSRFVISLILCFCVLQMSSQVDHRFWSQRPSRCAEVFGVIWRGISPLRFTKFP